MKITAEEMLELELLTELTHCKGWAYLRNILSNQRIQNLTQLHVHLRKHEDRRAGEYMARADEDILIMEIVKERINELKKIRL